MTQLDLGNIGILLGARVEYTHSNSTGRLVWFEENGSHVDTESNKVTGTRLDFFPNAHVRYDLTEWTTVRGAYTRSIVRPDYRQLAPFTLEHRQQRVLYHGNPDLEPMVSQNLDVSVDHYLNNASRIGVSGYYKRVTGLIFERSRTFVDEQENQWVERFYDNGSERASLYGVEVSWQQRLDFLPGLLGNLGTYTSYSWSESVFEVDFRQDDVRLPGHSPHVVNAALDYHQGRFSGQVSYHWTSSSVQRLSDQATAAPSVGSGQVYLDRYEHGAHDLSVSLGFRLSERFRFWMDASNLLRDERYAWDYSRTYYPSHIDHRQGVQFRAGIRFDY
jgi:TonB-dependent receptor